MRLARKRSKPLRLQGGDDRARAPEGLVASSGLIDAGTLDSEAAALLSRLEQLATAP